MTTPSSSPQEPLNERQSLELIQSMIRQTQGRFSENGANFLLWGWLVLIASLIHYTALKLGYWQYGPLAWLLMPVGAVAAWFMNRHEHERATVRTFVDRVLGIVWMGLGISMGLIFIISSITNIWTRTTYPMVLTIYGAGLFASGAVLRFRPLTLGGSACWVLAVVCAFLPFDGQLLCIAASTLVGYIVPGYLLRARYRLENPLTSLPHAAHAV